MYIENKYHIYIHEYIQIDTNRNTTSPRSYSKMDRDNSTSRRSHSETIAPIFSESNGNFIHNSARTASR